MCLQRGTTDGWESGSVSAESITVQVFTASHLFLHVNLQCLVPDPHRRPAKERWAPLASNCILVTWYSRVAASSLIHGAPHVCVEDLLPCRMQVYSHCTSLHLIPFYQEHKLEQNFFTICPKMLTGTNNWYPKTATPLT